MIVITQKEFSKPIKEERKAAKENAKTKDKEVKEKPKEKDCLKVTTPTSSSSSTAVKKWVLTTLQVSFRYPPASFALPPFSIDWWTCLVTSFLLPEWFHVSIWPVRHFSCKATVCCSVSFGTLANVFASLLWLCSWHVFLFATSSSHFKQFSLVSASGSSISASLNSAR